MQSHVCSNCKTILNGTFDKTLEVRHKTINATTLCADCLEGAKIIKIVLRRNADGVFTYEQFSPLEMEKRAFGKTG